MNEIEKVGLAMEVLVSQVENCKISQVELGNFQMGTTWASGQDYTAHYETSNRNGIVYWSHVGQEAHL